MKNRFALFSDSTLTKFAFFAFGLIVGGYYLFYPIDRILFASVFSLCASESLIRFSRRKGEQPTDERFNPTREYFRLNDKSVVYSLLTAIFVKRYDVIDKGEYLLINNAVVTGKISHSPLTPDDVVNATCEHKNKNRIILLCDSFLPETEKVATKLNVKLVDYPKVFNLLKRYDSLPTLPPKEKPSILERMRNGLNRKRAGTFLTCSAILFVFSRLVGSSVFYLAIAVVCLVLSLVSFILPAKN